MAVPRFTTNENSTPGMVTCTVCWSLVHVDHQDVHVIDCDFREAGSAGSGGGGGFGT